MTDWMEQARNLRNTVLWQSNSSVALMASLLREAYERGLEDAAKVADEWGHTGTMLLRAGEMTAQEKRTAKAIVTSIATAIRQIKEARE